MTRDDSNVATRTSAKRARATPGRPRARGSSSDISPRETILRVASELFAQRGYEGTTMAELADTVGIRGPSLYYHFKDKADILRALADIGLHQSLRESDFLRRDQGHSAPARLYHLMYESVVRLKTAPYEMSVLFDPAFRTEQFRDVYQRVTVWMDDLESIIADGIESEDFLPHDPPTAAYTIRGMVQTAIPQTGLKTTFDARTLADYVSSFALRALLREQARLPKIRKEVSELRRTKALVAEDEVPAPAHGQARER